MPLPTWLLHLQARTIRSCITVLQTYLSRPIYWYYSHTPLEPSFTLQIPSTSSPHGGAIKIVVYTPPNHKRNPKVKHALIVNFHGGGFVIGQGIDDERWARSVTRSLDAVVASVEYRLAPEYVYPTALQDSVDAVTYLVSHAAELGIDVDKIVTSGFSSGGNLAITVPMYLRRERGVECRALVAWYPGTDATRSRETRARSMKVPAKKLPRWLTDIFDAAHPRAIDAELRDPYRSPGLAEEQVLREALPPHVLLFTCEHDMLCEEGRQFTERLKTQRIVEDVVYREVKDVRHAWDKGPNPLPKPEKIYAEACTHLKEIFDKP